MYVPGEHVVLLAGETGLKDLDVMVQRSRSKPAPMLFVEEWVRSEFPSVEWVSSPTVSTDTPQAGTVPFQ